jgi:hypothetical protein
MESPPFKTRIYSHLLETNVVALDRLTKKRILYFSCALAVVVAGLASRRYRDRLPEFIAEYAGDALWVGWSNLCIPSMYRDCFRVPR